MKKKNSMISTSQQFLEWTGDVVQGAISPRPTEWRPKVRPPIKYWETGNRAWEDNESTENWEISAKKATTTALNALHLIP